MAMNTQLIVATTIHTVTTADKNPCVTTNGVFPKPLLIMTVQTTRVITGI